MSGIHQATFILMLIMMAVTEANNIGRYPESSDYADYVLALGRQNNCPSCSSCPAQPVCTSCPSVISTSSFTTCPTNDNIAKSSSATGSIDVSSISNNAVCNFAIATFPPFTKIRVKCPTKTLGTGTVQATHFALPDLTKPENVEADTLIASPAVYLAVDNKIDNGAVKCTWTSE